MSPLLRLFGPMTWQRAFPLLLCGLVTSMANWPAGDTFDRLLEFELALGGIALAQFARSDCPRPVLEYLASLPMERNRSLRAPQNAAAVAVVLIGLLVFVHEATGMAQSELSLLGIQIDSRTVRPLHPWLNLVGLPLCTFWMHSALMHRALMHRAGLRPAQDHSRTEVPSETGPAFLIGLTVGALALAVVLAMHHFGTDPWRQSVPGLLLLGVAWLAMRHHRTAVAAAPIDSPLPTTELPWTS